MQLSNAPRRFDSTLRSMVVGTSGGSQMQDVFLQLELSGRALAGSALELASGGEQLVAFVLRKPRHAELITGSVIQEIGYRLGLCQHIILAVRSGEQVFWLMENQPFPHAGGHISVMEHGEWVSARGALKNPLSHTYTPGLAALSKMQAGEERDEAKGMENAGTNSEAPMATAAAPSERMRMEADGPGPRGVKKAQGPGLSQQQVEEELAGWEKQQREIWAAQKMERPKPRPRDGKLLCVGPCKSRLDPQCFSREEFSKSVHRMTCRQCRAKEFTCYCMGCHRGLPRSVFSQTQLNKPSGQGRCIKCIDDARKEREAHQAEKKEQRSRLVALKKQEEVGPRKEGGDLSVFSPGARLLDIVGKESLLAAAITLQCAIRRRLWRAAARREEDKRFGQLLEQMRPRVEVVTRLQRSWRGLKEIYRAKALLASKRAEKEKDHLLREREQSKAEAELLEEEAKRLRANAYGAGQLAAVEQLRSNVLDEVAASGAPAKCRAGALLSGTCDCPKCLREKRQQAEKEAQEEKEEQEEKSRLERERKEPTSLPLQNGDVGVIVAHDQEEIVAWKAEVGGYWTRMPHEQWNGRGGRLFMRAAAVWEHGKEVVMQDPSPDFTHQFGKWELIDDEELVDDESCGTPLCDPVVVTDPDDGQEYVIDRSEFWRVHAKLQLLEGERAVLTARPPLCTVIGWRFEWDDEEGKQVVSEGATWKLGKQVLVHSLEPGWGPYDFVYADKYGGGANLEDIVVIRDPEEEEDMLYAVDRSELRREQEYVKLGHEADGEGST